MPSPITKEMGHKPYIRTKGIDGGYVNEMRRTAQRIEESLPAPLQKRSRGAVIDSRGAALDYGLIEVGTPAGVAWGLAFDAAGGMYHTVTGGDIYYNLAALNQTARDWEEISVAPNGDVYTVNFAAGIYIRTGGIGDFTLLEAGAFTCVACGANGSIYAIKGNQLYKWDGAAFISQAQTLRGYTGLTIAQNSDVYACVFGTGKVYFMSGGTGDFVELSQTITSCRSMASASNGDIFLAPYTGFDYNVYIRAGGAGDFVVHFDIARPTQCMVVSPAGELFISSSTISDNKIYRLNTTTTIPPAKDGISQTHPIPERKAVPMRNLRPYANRTFNEMQGLALPLDFSGREQQPQPEQAPPVLVNQIWEVYRFVRSGSPVVIDIPTNAQDPISGVEVFRHMNAGGDDGTASVAPNGTSVIYKPGAAGTALLTVHTRSGQQCTVNLMAK